MDKSEKISLILYLISKKCKWLDGQLDLKLQSHKNKFTFEMIKISNKFPKKEFKKKKKFFFR